MYGKWGRAAAMAILVAVMTVGSLRAQTIERVLAVVGSELILLSDYVAASRFALVDAPAAPDPVAAMLPALIERQLQLAEVNRYQPPEPPATVLDARLAAIRAEFTDSAAFDAALAESGLTVDRLRGLVRDNLRIESYRQQRFAASQQPTEDDVARYYRAHAAEFGKGAEPPSFEQVRDEARRRLIAERSASSIREWIDSLRRRTEVTILYRGAEGRSPQLATPRPPYLKPGTLNPERYSATCIRTKSTAAASARPSALNPASAGVRAQAKTSATRLIPLFQCSASTSHSRVCQSGPTSVAG